MKQKQGDGQSQTPDSLVHRMAGPSSGKAGLAKDQTEINHIILEASKGSKFFENEKKKDKELTVRIEKILKARDEAVKDADLNRIEASVDQTLVQLETQRDLTQIIVHVDMDAFYANVELLDNPQLQGKPFAVGRGVLTTASYEARKYGVRSGMAGFIAKKLCPELIFVPNRFSRYMELSKEIMGIFRRYDPNMCPGGCDEGYLNLTMYCEQRSITAGECVSQMRHEVFRETKLTVSAGIAPNKMLAKICSDKNKPNGQFQLDFDPDSIMAFMHDLSIRKVPGIGRVSERLLDAFGIKTCGDIYKQRAILFLMNRYFDPVFLLGTYLGIAPNDVRPHTREDRKSIGAERTFAPLGDKVKILEKLSEISAELERDMNETGWTGRTVTLKYKLDTYQVFTRARALHHWVSKRDELYAIGKDLLPTSPLTVRLIGLRVTKLKDLRATGPSYGIKRFFECDTSTEPRKKAKMDDSEGSMPRYHEHDESDGQEMGRQIESDEELFEFEPFSYPNHEQTETWPSVSTPKPKSRRPNESTMLEEPSRSIGNKQDEAQDQTCPVCNKTFEFDNAGLNTHVDFCLSRGAIMTAQVEASMPSHSDKQQLKPTSKEHRASKPASKRDRRLQEHR